MCVHCFSSLMISDKLLTKGLHFARQARLLLLPSAANNRTRSRAELLDSGCLLDSRMLLYMYFTRGLINVDCGCWGRSADTFSSPILGLHKSLLKIEVLHSGQCTVRFNPLPKFFLDPFKILQFLHFPTSSILQFLSHVFSPPSENLNDSEVFCFQIPVLVPTIRDNKLYQRKLINLISRPFHSFSIPYFKT